MVWKEAVLAVPASPALCWLAASLFFARVIRDDAL